MRFSNSHNQTSIGTVPLGFDDAQQPLTRELLDELREVVTDSYFKAALAAVGPVEISMAKWLTHVQNERKLYALIGDDPGAITFFEEQLFQVDQMSNEYRFTFLMRFHSQVLANWSGTEAHYRALIRRVAVALGSEVDKDSKAMWVDTMYPDNVLNLMTLVKRVELILYSNRALMAIAMFIFYVNITQFADRYYTPTKPPKLDNSK